MQIRFQKLTNNHGFRQLLRTYGTETCLLLKRDSQNYLFGWGMGSSVELAADEYDLEKIFDFIDAHQDQFRLGCFSYDLKNVTEPQLSSENTDHLGTPNAFFFVPEHIILVRQEKAYYAGPDKDAIDSYPYNESSGRDIRDVSTDWISDESAESYKDKIDQVLYHIQRGDIYEMNYCLNFRKKAKIDPVRTFFQLDELADAPFTAFGHYGDHFILSASPERFIKKSGTKLISQPIKGTLARGANPVEDEAAAISLQQDEKERAENIMIVDLVRNDLSKLAAPKSVYVDELCAVHTFKTVHQLISTVSCTIKPGKNNRDIFNALFPMGSMTGAPKISAMTIAEKTEAFKRGWYSGALGYFSPDGSFDFNVVIRSMIYDEQKELVSCSAGGAITHLSDPEKEYAECLLKVDALKKSLC